LSPDNIDWIAGFEELLGPVGRLPADDPVGISISGAQPRLIELIAGGHARVVASTAGVAGEAAAKPARSYLEWPMSGSPVPATDADEFYRHLLSGEIVGVAPLPIVSDRMGFTATQPAMDWRCLLPPFFPHFRSADRLFGATLYRVLPQSLLCERPFAVFHDRKEPNRVARSELQSFQVRFAWTVASLMDGLPRQFPASSHGHHYDRTGRYLATLGSLDEPEFRRALRGASLRRFSLDTVIHQEMVEEMVDPPPWWIEDLQAFRQHSLQTIQLTDGIRPDEFESLPSQSWVDEMRLCLRRFGELLIHWPAIMEMVPGALTASGIGTESVVNG
jgi:hypothetical protein